MLKNFSQTQPQNAKPASTLSSTYNCVPYIGCALRGFKMQNIGNGVEDPSAELRVLADFVFSIF